LPCSYLAATLRTPHSPDNADTNIVIGVRATDNGGQTVEQLLDVIYVDDLEAPAVVQTVPESDFSMLPGDSVSISGSADDNYYIGTIIPVLIDSYGTETVLEWQALSRDDRVKQVSIPNPTTFGEIVVAERFKVDFSGRIKLPLSFLPEAGKAYTFKLRVNDFGINSSETSGIKLTILKDDEAPAIKFIKPATTVYEMQSLSASVSFTDNIGVESYTLSILGQEATPLASHGKFVLGHPATIFGHFEYIE